LGQRTELIRQVQALEAYSLAKGWEFETIQDYGSGLNYKRKGLSRLLLRILKGEVKRLVLTHRDRLLRLGSELVFTVCAELNTEVIIISKAQGEVPSEQELLEDIAELVVFFGARLHGLRSRRN
jgi:putative resolvase